MFKFFDYFLNIRSQPFILFLAAASIAAIALVDLWTGREVGVSFFYLIPVAVVTWYVSTRLGFLTCLVCAMVWFVVDQKAYEAIQLHPLVPYWNAAIRLGFFLTTSHLLASLQFRLEREKDFASTDDLTRLTNSRTFRYLTQELIYLAQRTQHPLALAYIDIDNFKQVNDQQGHAEGDRVLRTVGDTLKHNVRASDVVGRVGGDEFMIAMPNTGLAAAREVFAKIHHALVTHDELTRQPIGFSIGVAVFVNAPASLNQAINCADQLMYRVKLAGKNNVVYEEYAQC